MRRNIDIVIQGGLWPSTIVNAHEYLENENINKVYICTWKDEPHKQEITDERVILIENDKPEYIGPSNLHLHLASTRSGLQRCETAIVIKVRSDEKISNSGINTWLDYFDEHKNEKTLNYLDGTKQKSKIFTIAMNTNFPYHPQDHVYIGYKSDLLKFYNMPFSKEPPQGSEPIDFSIHLRNPIYIGANYYAMFFEKAKHHLENWKEYLADNATKKQEAMDFYLENLRSIFIPLPRIDLWWEKQNSQYLWDWYEGMGDTYGD